MMSTIWDPESPSLHPAIVCYADILAFRNLSKKALASDEGEQFLRRIKYSLNAAYEDVRELSQSTEWGPGVLDVKFFTDDIVVAFPMRNFGKELGEGELGTILTMFGRAQSVLAKHGYFLRGGIAQGQHFQDQSIAFGEALLKAVDLNEKGKPPRLVIGSSVECLIAAHLTNYADMDSAPHFEILLEDPNDGRLFINYLWRAFEEFPDDPIDRHLLAAHRNNVVKGLEEHRPDTDVGKKYSWLATYHNYVCRDFAEHYPTEEAREALNYLVHFAGLPNSILPPRRLDSDLLEQRLENRLS